MLAALQNRFGFAQVQSGVLQQPAMAPYAVRCDDLGRSDANGVPVIILLGAPGADGVFRYQPTPESDPPAPVDDSDEVADWFNTRTDPDIAEAVAKAEAEARRSLPAAGVQKDPSAPLILEPGTPEPFQAAPGE
jgi:hypothetical protein